MFNKSISFTFVVSSLFFGNVAIAEQLSSFDGYWYSYFNKEEAQKQGVEIPDFCLDTDQCINPVIVKFTETNMVRCFINKGTVPDDVTLDTVLNTPLQLNLDVDSLYITYTFNVATNEITLVNSDGQTAIWNYQPQTNTINDGQLHHLTEDQAKNIFGCN